MVYIEHEFKTSAGKIFVKGDAYCEPDGTINDLFYSAWTESNESMVPDFTESTCPRMLRAEMDFLLNEFINEAILAKKEHFEENCED